MTISITATHNNQIDIPLKELPCDVFAQLVCYEAEYHNRYVYKVTVRDTVLWMDGGAQMLTIAEQEKFRCVPERNGTKLTITQH